MSKSFVLIFLQDGLLKESLERSLGATWQPLFVNQFADIYDLATQQNVSCVVVGSCLKGRDSRTKIEHFRRRFETIPVVLYNKFTKFVKQVETDNCICFHALDELLQALPTIIKRHTFQPAFKIFDIHPEKCSPRIRKVLQMMREEFRENITVEKIAEYLGVHRCHLQREWRRECVSITVKQLLIGLKLHYSTFLMQNTGLKLKDIARLVGFANEHEFYRSFHHQMGMTALSYRQDYAFADFRAVYWNRQRAE